MTFLYSHFLLNWHIRLSFTYYTSNHLNFNLDLIYFSNFRADCVQE